MWFRFIALLAAFAFFLEPNVSFADQASDRIDLGKKLGENVFGTLVTPEGPDCANVRFEGRIENGKAFVSFGDLSVIRIEKESPKLIDFFFARVGPRGMNVRVGRGECRILITVTPDTQ